MNSIIVNLLCLSYISDAYSPRLVFQRSLRPGNCKQDAISSSAKNHKYCNSNSNRNNIAGVNQPLHMSDTDIIDRTTTTPPTMPPLSSHTFAGQVEQALLSRFEESKIERVLQSWRLSEMGYEHVEFVGNQQSPPITDADESSKCYQHSPSFVPGLKAVAWWDDVDKLGWAASLQNQFPAIREEFMSVMGNPDKLQSDGNNIWAGALTTDAESYGVSILFCVPLCSFGVVH